MPWTVGDVDSHKKGLTPAQKSKWVKIANAALKRCQSKGGSGCDASAIRIANAAFCDDGTEMNALFMNEECVIAIDNMEVSSEDWESVFAVKPGEPLANFHSCRLKSPDYDSYAYKKCARKSDGKCIDHVYGIPKEGASEIQALRYPTGSWSASEARSHCGDQGAFTAAKKKTKTSMEVETMNEKQKLPKAALHFMDHECFAKVVSDADGAKARLNMVCYSGKPIKKHWYWGDLVIDLNGMSFPKKKFPILENHREDRKIGFSNGKPLVEEHQLRLDPEKVEFVETPYSDEFIRLSKQGFPYESSIYAVPSSVERLEPGTSADVNGFTMKGPATIWRQCTFKEASICVFGHDSNTHSEAFAEGDIELELEVANLKLVESGQQESTEKEVIEDMTLAELKEKNPEVFSALSEEIRGEVTAELQAKFDQEKKDLENKHSQEKDGLTGRILELEKKDEIRSMNEMRSRAASIWTSKLGESNIPDHLFEKVSQHVSYSKFVKDGVLDEKGFNEAIDAEIKDWESKGVTSSVLGMSFTKKGETDDSGGDTSQEAKENEEAVNQLAALAGLPAN